MDKRGLTLIELLLAIGLVLILGALVLPAVYTGLGERSFESSVEVVRSQLLLARAHAQVTRRPVEVTYEDVPPRKPGVRARYFLVDAPDTQTQRRTANRPEDSDRLIVEGWADRDLPDGLSVTDSSETELTPAIAPAASTAAPAVLRLAVFMPDGSAPLTRSVRIRDEHGRRGVIEVNPWTGLPSFERSAATDEVTADETQAEAEPAVDEPVEDFRAARPPPREEPPGSEAPAEDTEPASDDPADLPTEDDPETGP